MQPKYEMKINKSVILINFSWNSLFFDLYSSFRDIDNQKLIFSSNQENNKILIRFFFSRKITT